MARGGRGSLRFWFRYALDGAMFSGKTVGAVERTIPAKAYDGVLASTDGKDTQGVCRG